MWHLYLSRYKSTEKMDKASERMSQNEMVDRVAILEHHRRRASTTKQPTAALNIRSLSQRLEFSKMGVKSQGGQSDADPMQASCECTFAQVTETWGGEFPKRNSRWHYHSLCTYGRKTALVEGVEKPISLK